MTFSIFDSVLILLISALLVISLFRALKLPELIGYILVGVLVGPSVLGLIPSNEATHHFAEFGVVLLMFTIGLEFSLSLISKLKKQVFVYGGLEFTFAILITALIGSYIFRMSLGEVIVVGAIAAMSSTAIVTKQLSVQSELHSVHGRNAIGILLFQDLAVIPVLILVPSLTDINITTLCEDLAWAFVKGLGAIAIILGGGYFVLRPLFRKVSKTNSLEMFTLMTLLVTLGAAWITNKMGLSLALGAFIAGMMLGETEFRHQIENEIRPFRDVLLGFFFVSVGLQLDVHIFSEAWIWILALLTAILFMKTILVTLIARVMGDSINTSLRTGLILAQGSEFGFAILTLALSYDVIPKDYGQVILAALLVSMVIAPILIYYNKAITVRASVQE